MNYYIFIDESGDHGLKNIDPSFPIFVLCGIVMSDKQYQELRGKFNTIKNKFWNDKKVIFHSSDIRKCEKEFKILFDLNIKADFYKELDKSIVESEFSIISSAIRKENYIKKYGKLKSDVYEIALSFIVERSIFYIDSLDNEVTRLYFIMERRGKKEDNKLRRHFESLMQVGTYYLTPERLKSYNLKIEFRDKKQNINGLQLADLAAYPIARYVLDKDRANPAFEIVKPKIYSKGTRMYGLKIFP